MMNDAAGSADKEDLGKAKQRDHGSDEQVLKKELEELQHGKKQKFEDALSSLKSLLRLTTLRFSFSPKTVIYSVVCRVATVLKTRYTSPGFWLAGYLFEGILLWILNHHSPMVSAVEHLEFYGHTSGV
uniref:Uncharacterized protein n=1 Tax=Salix viminalis TaxID=40686 RepID=A0A6N2L146_SALVM